MTANSAAALLVLDAAGLETIEYLLSRHKGEVKLPNLAALGLGEIVALPYKLRVGKKTDAESYAARIEQASASADSVVGHREMAGIIDGRVFGLFHGGFKKDYIAELERRIGRKTMFNKMAGGMEAIELNAAEHAKTGFPIVYASKCDPLIQIAMDEAVIPVREQHSIADAALGLALEMNIPVTRAIARAYIRGAGGAITRTANRHDAVLPLERQTLADILLGRNVWTAAVGKTSELVNSGWQEKIKITSRAFVEPALEQGFVHPQSKDTNPLSAQGALNALICAKSLHRPEGTFIFANFVDTDSLYGHVRDVAGSLASLEAADRMLGVLMKKFGEGDLLVITADHGMAHRADYGYHNREPLPLLAKRFGRRGLGGIKPGAKKTLADAGYMIAQFFGCEKEFIEKTGTENLLKE